MTFTCAVDCGALAASIGLASRGQSSPTIWFASAAIAILASLILIGRQRAASAWTASGGGFCRRRISIRTSGGRCYGRYARASVQFRRSDRDGEVTALSDGHTLEVPTFAESHRQ
jgi:hypothetical protein